VTTRYAQLVFARCWDDVRRRGFIADSNAAALVSLGYDNEDVSHFERHLRSELSIPGNSEEKPTSPLTEA
jgi:hypothetical protein